MTRLQGGLFTQAGHDDSVFPIRHFPIPAPGRPRRHREAAEVVQAAYREVAGG